MNYPYRKYAKQLIKSTIMLIIGTICAAIWLFINNAIISIIGGCIALPTLIGGFIYSVVTHHRYNEYTGDDC